MSWRPARTRRGPPRVGPRARRADHDAGRRVERWCDDAARRHATSQPHLARHVPGQRRRSLLARGRRPGAAGRSVGGGPADDRARPGRLDPCSPMAVGRTAADDSRSTPSCTRLHVRGFAGTFRGAISRLAYLRDLGVDVIELMPVHPFDTTDNYWGYMPIVWGAVHRPYADAADAAAELAELVEAAHDARHRGVGRCRLQPHRRGRRVDAHVDPPRARRRPCLPSPRRRRLHRRQRVRQRHRSVGRERPQLGARGVCSGTPIWASTASGSIWRRC